MIKKMVSLTLALVMCLSLCVPAMAITDESVYLESAISILNRIGAPTDEIGSVSFDGEVLRFSIRSETYEMKSLSNGQSEFTVTEGDNKDTLLFDVNGNIQLINGKSIQQTISVLSAEVENIIEPRNSETDYVTSCPYGSPSDYSSYQYTKTYAEIYLEKKVKKYTTAALASILAGLTGGFWASVGAGLCYTVADDILGGATDGQVLAHHADYYYHRNGHSVPNYGGIREVDKIVNYFEGSDGGSSTSVIYMVKNFY